MIFVIATAEYWISNFEPFFVYHKRLAISSTFYRCLFHTKVFEQLFSTHVLAL
jgi:hypothetical protein